MKRRRTLGNEVAEMGKEWVELLNERERTVTDLQNVEFDLATNEIHSEYWVFFSIRKHTGENTVNGPVTIKINGASLGYYMLAQDYSKALIIDASIHAYMQPVGVIDYTRSSVEVSTNSIQVTRNAMVGEETGTGKLTLRFPANYTGTIKNVKVLCKIGG